MVFVKGTNYLLNATAFNQSKATGYKTALGTLAGVPPCWVSVTDVTAYNLNSNGSLGSPARRLLQTPDSGLSGFALEGQFDQSPGRRRLSQSSTGAALGINAFLPSTDANGVVTSLGDAYSNGQLASGILPDPLELELLNITPASSIVSATTLAASNGGSHKNLGLKVGLPVALGVLLALLLCCCLAFCCRRYKRNRDTDRRQTLQEQTLFSHKANPMYDTTQTLTTTSSSRGDDFEIIRVPPGPTEALAPRETLLPADPSRTYMPPVYTAPHMRSGDSLTSSMLSDTDYAEAFAAGQGRPRAIEGGIAPGAGPPLTSFPIIPVQHENPFIGPIGDTDTSSDFEAIPTMRGLAFRDQPSPPGSEFNTPRAPAAGRATPIPDDEGQFETPRATAAGAFGSMNPVQLQGPVFQAPAMFDTGSVFDSSGNEQDSQFTYPDMPAPGPMPAGFGSIRTLAGPQGPQGPHDAYAPLSDMPLLSSDSSPEPTRVAEGSYYRYSSPSDASSGHPFMLYQQSPNSQSLSPGPSLASPTRLLQSPGEGVNPSQGLVSSPAGSPQLGGMTHAPSSHFVSSGSFDFGGRGDSLGTTGLLPALELGNLGSQPLEMTEMELESTPESDTFVSPREWGTLPPASLHGPAGPSGPSTGPSTTNPMFGSDILDTQGSDIEHARRRNPVWESRSRQSPQGGNPNPLYGSGEDILASRDSSGAMRNPVWESHSAEAPSGNSNPLFGTDVLDTTDSLTGENPLYETPRSRAIRRRPQGRQ
ncbi:hypothetical protein WJX79_003977 [Trebouxia sp. C0005]